ncbi:MAG: ATPase, T2SS/T4P/T4SS family [Opitutales bacterium]
MTSADEFITQLVVEKGLVPADVVDAARSALQNATDLSKPRQDVIDKLIEDGFIDGQQVTQMLADEFGMPVVPPGPIKPTKEALEAVSQSLATRYRVFPLKLEGNVLQIAISDPLDVDSIDHLSHVLNLSVEPSIATKESIDTAIEKFYQEDSVEHLLSELAGSETGATNVEIEGLGVSDRDPEVNDADAPIIRLVSHIISEAIKRRASDIHLEPMEKRFRVRYRIDGVLQEMDNPPKRLQLSIISRLKIMAQISIAEKRVPQDGRIQVAAAGKEIDLRVSSLPTAHGESIVMRILDKEGLSLGLPELGFLSDDQAVIERMISLPDGIILVTGPTGSGKTTTLYACLNYINKPDRKIITVEDPVEYQLAGINQVQVKKEVNMTFSSALRAMLRQAPNIIMIGEIRDFETADIAINASLTGHMVFSTLHTNDAPSAVSRLVDIGVKPFLVSASLRATMAQRLVRAICKECKQPYMPDSKELLALRMTEDQVQTASFMKGAGCTKCNGTGFRGRKGIFEIFIINEEIQRMIYDNVSAQKLRARAREQGMRSMREDGMRKVTTGMTTVAEVVSTTVGDVL